MQKLLLHTCCAPCSCAVIDELKSTYDLTVFFYNPNIYPEAEYQKRKAEVVRICQLWHIPMIDGDYEPEVWQEAIKGLENEIESGSRCKICFLTRLKQTAILGQEKKFQIFATTLSSGRNKSAEVLNLIGQKLATDFGLEFLSADWKKAGRQDKARTLINQHQIYQQNYCGCRYSLNK